MYSVLRQMVREELEQTPMFAFGRMEEPESGLRRAAFRGASSIASGIRDISGTHPQPQDNGMFIHLGGMQAAAFWRSSHVNVGGGNPTVISV